MKVGDYVRTDDGCICKVLKYTNISDNDFYVNTDSKYDVIYKSWIVKSSPNIIDLIEVGDYVNGYEIIDIIYEKDNIKYLETEITKFDNVYPIGNVDIYKNDIKSILTKEQFKSMEYRIGE